MTRDELVNVAAILTSGTNHDAKTAVRKAKELIQAAEDELRDSGDKSAEQLTLREPADTSRIDASGTYADRQGATPTEPVVTKKKEGR